MSLIVNIFFFIFSAKKINLSSRLSPSDWLHLPAILNKAETTELEINTDVDWEQLETAMIDLPGITKLSLSDIQLDKIGDLLTNINSKELLISLSGEVRYNSETWGHIKRLTTLCKQVVVDTVRLSTGMCSTVKPSTNQIEMEKVDLKSGKDVVRLRSLVSQYKSWRVGGRWWELGGVLSLRYLGSDDWARLAKLLATLTSVNKVRITSKSTSYPPRETLGQLWKKTKGLLASWTVNNVRYSKTDLFAFYRMFNKHFEQ